MNLLPADIYTVINKTILTNEDKNNLIALYEPIIGATATSLYLTLWSDLDKLQIQSKDYTHHHLMCLMKMDLNTLQKSRESLEAVGLLKTYYKEGEVSSYIYELYSPLSPRDFFAHPILNVVLYNNLGKKEYENIICLYQKINFNLDGYKDITKSINETFTSSTVVPEFDVKDKEYQSISAKDAIDFNLLLSSIPKNILNEKSLNKRMKELINNLSFIYNLDTLKMAEILRSTINEKGFVDAKELRKKTREYYTYINNGKLPTLVYRSQPEYLKTPKGDSSNRAKMIYVFENTTPYDFLKNKYNGVPPTPRDLKLLEDLLEDDVFLTDREDSVFIDAGVFQQFFQIFWVFGFGYIFSVHQEITVRVLDGTDEVIVTQDVVIQDCDCTDSDDGQKCDEPVIGVHRQERYMVSFFDAHL